MINTAQVTPSYGEYLREVARRDLKRRSAGRQKLHQLRTVAATAASGFGRGLRQTSPLSAEWDISGTCTDSRPVVMLGAKSRIHGDGLVRAGGGTFQLLMHTRCRKCADCLRRRRNLWAYRAQVEMGESVRTWFATFTCNPHHHALMVMRASARLARGGTVLDQLPPADRDYVVTSEYQKEITLYFKRLRKATGAYLRYICVKETHKSGLPHFHALIHEVTELGSLRHADLTYQWKLGFTKFKLVSGVKSAWYVSKYLAKEVSSRVRASIRYGQRVSARVQTYLEARQATRYRDQISPSTHSSEVVQPNKDFENANESSQVQSAPAPIPPAGPSAKACREAWEASYSAIKRIAQAFGTADPFAPHQTRPGRPASATVCAGHSARYAPHTVLSDVPVGKYGGELRSVCYRGSDLRSS